MLTYFIFISYNLRYFPLRMQKKKKKTTKFMHIFLGRGIVGKSRTLKLKDQVLS